jgi:hypothetical protein
MPRVGLESTTPVFERAKTVHALDRTATVIGDRTATSYDFNCDSFLIFVFKLLLKVSHIL